MRATFAVVLAAGVAATVGLSMAMRPASEEPIRGDGPPEESLDTAPVAAPRADASVDPAQQVVSPPSIAARIDDLLNRNELSGATRVLLSVTATEWKDVAVRDRAFLTADALVAAADAGNDESGTRARLDARRLYAMLYASDAATAGEMTRAFVSCTRLHQALVFGNGAPGELVLRHKVQPGESVWALAKGAWRQRGVSVPAGFVLHVNGIADARRLRAGQTLRVPLEPIRLLIRKSRFELAVLLGGAPVERFPVAIGTDASTPVGVFRVRDRLKDPDWYFRGRRIAFGDPQNIIGTRWIGLSGSTAIDGIGIHGTSDDTSIGKAASMGCVRLHNPDVERLFDWVDAGVEVEIRD